MPRLLWVVSLLAGIVFAFFLFIRPWYQHWGATDDEARASLPGDELVSSPADQETRAITIHAGIERVWPWLAQLGQDRGGFYSYDLLENLVGCEMPNEDRLQPDRQSWRVGDKLWMYPKDKAGGLGFATLESYIPGRALGFRTQGGSWSFVLVPMGDSATRLLIRGRVAPGRSPIAVAFDRAIFQPMHFVMERRTMTGLKQLAEDGHRHRTLNNVQVALWTITFGFFVAALLLVLRHDRIVQPLMSFLASTIVFQVLTLGQPAIALEIVLVVAAGATLLWPVRSDAYVEHRATIYPKMGFGLR